MVTKIVAVTLTGSYPVPWFPYVIGSIYNCVDEIIVANGGWNFPKYDNPDTPLDLRETYELDVNKKIHEVRGVSWEKAHDLVKPETEGNRALGITVASEEAAKYNPDWALFFTSDQVAYPNAKHLRELTKQTRTDGYQFYEYKAFWGNQHWMIPDGTDPYSPNDGIKLYKYRGQSGEKQWWKGEGGIMSYRDQTSSEIVTTGHFRECWPTKTKEIDREALWKWAVERSTLHFWDHAKVLKQPIPFSQCLKQAVSHADNILERCNNLVPANPEAPLICRMEPYDYVVGNYPK